MGQKTNLLYILEKASLLWLAFFVCAVLVNASHATPPQGVIGLNGGYHLPHEQLDVVGAQPVPTRLHGGPFIGLHGGYHIIDPLAIELHLGFLPAYAGQQNAVVLLMPFHMDLIAYFSQGALRPYASVGAGAYAMIGGELEKDMDFMFTGSLGMQIEVIDLLAIRVDARILASDGREQTLGHSLLFTLGVDVLLGGSDEEEATSEDRLPRVNRQPLNARKCTPNEAGQLPEVCEDRDEDGINNTNDACPDTAGIKKFKGCPDTDNDGLPDTRDRCPVTQGVASLGGCPDQDGDGIEDSRDGCPQVAGSIERHGCPDRLAPELERLNGNLLGVSFSKGSTLSPGSRTSLARLASVLSRHPDISVEILVYTQTGRNSGQQSELAQERAQVLFNTLVQMGAIPTRLKAVGLGSVIPPGENDAIDRVDVRIKR
jgi:outer membrane protein OmpA-like peptidoglycan-associated protein